MNTKVCPECGVDRDDLLELKSWHRLFSFIAGCFVVVVVSIGILIAQCPSKMDACAKLCKERVSKWSDEHSENNYGESDQNGKRPEKWVTHPETRECQGESK